MAGHLAIPRRLLVDLESSACIHDICLARGLGMVLMAGNGHPCLVPEFGKQS